MRFASIHSQLEIIIAKSIKQQIADIEENISKLQVKKVELENMLANEINEDKLVPGTNIVFVYGKGETKKDLTGTVVGIKLADPADKKSSTWLNVAVGEGFEAQTHKIIINAVKQIVTVAEIEDTPQAA